MRRKTPPFRAKELTSFFQKLSEVLRSKITELFMNPETVMTVGHQALEITVILSAPPLLAALAVGLLISLFQAATQINEMTLSFIPKLLALVLVMLITGHWMIERLMDYTRRLYESIPTLLG